MRLTVQHTTRYKYESPIANAMQQLRLTPPNNQAQKIVDWTIDAPGILRSTTYRDAFGNLVHMVSTQEVIDDVEITAHGTLDVVDTNGVTGRDKYAPPRRIYTRITPLTKPNQAIRRLGSIAEKQDQIPAFHELMHSIREKVAYKTGVTETHETAASALAAGEGVCQDHAHIFIAAARSIGVPARYVSGYMLLEDEQVAEAHHAWAEVFIEDLGWVAFDISNEICPTDRYIRLTTGLDSRSAAPIRGIRFGGREENLDVEVNVAQGAMQQQQQQQSLNS
ncbi:transglutaminase-like putative cysteine protease [Roseibium hamelinense]|uniref:Transglutaminase-like putative cysteine protease n=1 Tax=Roseibium hamelinense TaxID=150831 RepID=A0A562SFA2_9HYPH|nr:transglutaminase family protein [Roseibium hamelinense]MTI44153.1 transglutaminase family protein [Roseibium hamelinense]TWI80065.1 transglutaminase-like putative cysteine protease [Roseibium hamelinense]